MDASFQFLLPKEADLSPFNFQIPMYEWDGVNYPQGPPECKFGKNFRLVQEDELNPMLWTRYLPNNYPRINWQIIEVFGDGIHIYWEQLYGSDKQEEAGFTLKDLIQLMLGNKPNWMVAFERNYDDGYGEPRKGKVEDIVPAFQLLNSLETGFLLYS
jgi:hypothetical protein